MRILALDASTQALSVAVYDDTPGGHQAEHFELAPQGHASRLLPAAQRLLDDAGWTLAALDGFAFARGPGAFTGLRIAAGLIQGLAAGVDRPVAPISTLAAIAWRALVIGNAPGVRVVQDARMGEIYTADYAPGDDAPRPRGAERVIAPADLDAIPAGYLLAGNGWPVVAAARGAAVDDFSVVENSPHALDIAQLGAAVLARGEGVPAAQALPVYVRDDVARKPRSA